MGSTEQKVHCKKDVLFLSFFFFLSVFLEFNKIQV